MCLDHSVAARSITVSQGASLATGHTYYLRLKLPTSRDQNSLAQGETDSTTLTVVDSPVVDYCSQKSTSQAGFIVYSKSTLTVPAQ